MPTSHRSGIFVIFVILLGRTEDIERNGYTFTDGCGEMSLDIAQQVTQVLGVSDSYQSQPDKVNTIISTLQCSKK